MKEARKKPDITHATAYKKLMREAPELLRNDNDTHISIKAHGVEIDYYMDHRVEFISSPDVFIQFRNTQEIIKGNKVKTDSVFAGMEESCKTLREALEIILPKVRAIYAPTGTPVTA